MSPAMVERGLGAFSEADPIFILADGGDLLVFRTQQDLERYVESPDIDGYRAFDSNGAQYEFAVASAGEGSHRIGIAIQPVSLVKRNDRSRASEELKALVASYLDRKSSGMDHQESNLEMLLATLVDTIGFSR
jgi:hypothetical protein